MSVNFDGMSEQDMRNIVRDVALELMRRESYSAWELEMMFRTDLSEAHDIRQHELWAEWDAQQKVKGTENNV